MSLYQWRNFTRWYQYQSFLLKKNTGARFGVIFRISSLSMNRFSRENIAVGNIAELGNDQMINDAAERSLRVR
jgi:hypothetical protein